MINNITLEKIEVHSERRELKGEYSFIPEVGREKKIYSSRI